jgi:diadenosine tetraphosphate (Ap4A) HIT family hydrolase
MNNKCLFCDFYKNKTKVIFENEKFFAIFDDFPVSAGHALVIPKKHIVSIFDLSEDEWSYLLPAIKEVKKIIESKVEKKPDGYNIGINEGETAGRTIHHLHVQTIPRYLGDVKNPTGGIRCVIPGKADYTK